MQVTIGSWAYRIRYLPLRDAGRAVVSCTGVEAAITLREEGHGLRVMACHCTVEGVSVDMNEARLSWLYNTLAPVVRGHLRRAVSTGLEYAVRDALEHHMEQWADWATHDLDQLPVRR